MNKIILIILMTVLMAACGRDNPSHYKCREDQTANINAYIKECTQSSTNTYSECYRMFVKNFCDYME